MSTNYYLKRIPTVEEVNTIKDVVASATVDNIETVFRDQSEYIDNIAQEIHLGKRSCGWRFLWELWGNKYYECSIKSIREFLLDKTANGWTIINEYNETFSVDEFFNEIDSWLYEGDYGTESKHSKLYYGTPSDFYKIVYDKEIGEKLRFSTSEDFR